MAYYDTAMTFGIKVLSYQGTADVMSYYPETVREWISRHGGLTSNMKTVKNGPELWAIIDPCPEEFASPFVGPTVAHHTLRARNAL